MTGIRLRRSVLFMPADNTRAIEKARQLEADALILDLEDAVAPDAKPTARATAVAALTEGGFGHREVAIRVNATDTPGTPMISRLLLPLHARHWSSQKPNPPHRSRHWQPTWIDLDTQRPPHCG